MRARFCNEAVEGREADSSSRVPSRHSVTREATLFDFAASPVVGRREGTRGLLCLALLR